MQFSHPTRRRQHTLHYISVTVVMEPQDPRPSPLLPTSSLCSISAPRSNSNSTVEVCPLIEASRRAVFPSYKGRFPFTALYMNRTLFTSKTTLPYPCSGCPHSCPRAARLWTCAPTLMQEARPSTHSTTPNIIHHHIPLQLIIQTQ